MAARSSRRLCRAGPPDDVAAGRRIPGGADFASARRPGRRPNRRRPQFPALPNTSDHGRRAGRPTRPTARLSGEPSTFRRAIAHSRRTSGDESCARLSTVFGKSQRGPDARRARPWRGCRDRRRQRPARCADCRHRKRFPTATRPAPASADWATVRRVASAPARPRSCGRPAPSRRDNGSPGSGFRAPRSRPGSMSNRDAARDTGVLGGATRKMRPRLMSPMWWPPTPGSYQSATISEPSGATQTSDGRNQLSRVPRRMSTVAARYPAPAFSTG